MDRGKLGVRKPWVLLDDLLVYVRAGGQVSRRILDELRVGFPPRSTKERWKIFPYLGGGFKVHIIDRFSVTGDGVVVVDDVHDVTGPHSLTTQATLGVSVALE